MNKSRKQKGAEAFCITVILIFLFLLVRILYQPEATAERLSISFHWAAAGIRYGMEKKSPWSFHARF